MQTPSQTQTAIATRSELTCPKCGFAETLDMPSDACLFFHPCGNCAEILRPLEGDCCVFCSFGTVACPPIQEKGCC